MEHFMLDLETMGTRPNAAIIAIGVVEFDVDKRELGQEFYAVIDLESAVKAGGVIDPGTVRWWLQQNDEARRAVSKAGSTISKVLEGFSAWLELCCPNIGSTKVWGNGASFDNVLLSEAYKRLGLNPPWKFWNDRCYRTVKNMYPNIRMEHTGISHHALDDARNQATHLLKIFEANQDSI